MADTNTNQDDNVRLNQIIDNGLNIYGSREKIRSDLINLAKRYLNMSQSSDISKASYLAYLIDMLSILSSNQIYYQSKIYNEFFIVTAVMNESVQNLAKWIGYTIPKAVCATVKIMFVVPLKFSVDAVNFQFGKYFQCRAGEVPYTIKSNNNLFGSSTTSAVFSMSKDKLTYSAKGQIINNSAITVRDYNGFYQPVFLAEDKSYCAFNLEFEQCEYQIQTFNIPETLQLNQFYHKTLAFNGQVSDLQVWICEPTNGQTLVLNSSQADDIQKVESFDPSEPIIDSSGTSCSFKQWTECINGIYTISSISKQFDWVGYYNKGIISFGNGILGKQPNPGSFVVVVLKLTKGADGNVIDNVIKEGDELNIRIDGNTTANIAYTCTNNNAAYGGKDILTTSEIKNNAIVNLKARKRLVTEDDYNNINAVIQNTTLSDCAPILKRSDIKINDITLYFILNYLNNSVNEIVPTRNVQIDLIEPKFTNSEYTINKNTIVPVGPEELPFATIFNMTLNQNTRMASFDYTCTNVQGVSSELYTQSVYDTLNQSAYINATTTDFSIDFDASASINGKFPVFVNLNLSHIPNKVVIEAGKNRIDINYVWTVSDLCRHFTDESNTNTKTVNNFEIVHFKAVMTTKWGDFDDYTELSPGYKEIVSDVEIEKDNDTGLDMASKTYQSFVFMIPSYKDVPQGKQRFEFQILCYAPKTDADGYIYCKHNCNIIRAIDPQGNYYDAEGADVTDPVVMEWKIMKTYYSDVIITQDLSDYMQSSITVDNYYKGIAQYKFSRTGKTFTSYDYTQEQIESMLEDGSIVPVDVYHVHEVPSIYQMYYNDVMNKKNSDFELTVLQKLLENINFSSARMMTDFTNVKFADTYGSMKNLMYNTPLYVVESRYNHTPWWRAQQGTSSFPENVNTRENPEYEPPKILETPIYYIANGKIDSMGSTPVAEYLGYIVLRIPTMEGTGVRYTYTLITPNVGDCIKIKDELDYDGNMQTCYWTGHEWMPVEQYSIPMKLELKVQVDEDKVSTSDDALKEQIVDVLSKYYNDSTKMGLQRPIDRSEITRVCRSIDGVQYVEVLNPQFDIKFDYEVNDLTQEQLLGFTPQYTGFRTLTGTITDYKETSISIEIVRK